MKFKNLKNMDKILVRKGPKVELAPLKMVLSKKPGYYSQTKDLKGLETIDEDLVYKEDGVYYLHREGVNFRITVPGAFENLVTKLTFNKTMLDKANLNVIVTQITNNIWENIGDMIGENTLTVLQSEPKKVNGENIEFDTYASLFSIIYHLIYFIVACNKCEPSADLDLIVNNLKDIDDFWTEDENFQTMVEVLSAGYKIVLDEFVQPFVKSEQEMVGQANLNKNVIEALKLYDLMKTKIDYALAGQVDEVGPFIHLSDYLAMIIGQEPDFYKMVTLIKRERLDKKVSRDSKEENQFDDRLIIDEDVLESQLLRIIRTVLNYQEQKQNTMRALRKQVFAQTKCENKTDAIFANNRAFIQRMGNLLELSYAALGDLKEVNTTKVVTYTETIYQTRFKLNKQFKSPEMNAWVQNVLRQGKKSTRIPLTITETINDETPDGTKLIGQRFTNKDYRTLMVEMLIIDKGDGKQSKVPDEIVVEYRIPNMPESFYSFTDLIWEV